MMKVKGIFAVSLIAIMVVGGAYANVASSGYVDEKIDGLATVAKTGARLLRQRFRDCRRLLRPARTMIWKTSRQFHQHMC